PAGLEETDGLRAHAQVGIVQQGFQNRIAHYDVGLDERTNGFERLVPHTGIGVVAQRVNQRLAHFLVAGALAEQINGIHADARVVIAVRGVHEQLLDTGIVERALRTLRRNRVVLDVNVVAARLLVNGADAGDGSFLRLLLGDGSDATRRAG